MEIETERTGEGRGASTILSWVFEGEKITLKFSTIARAVYSNTSKKVYVSEYIQSAIYTYSENGELLKKITIPEKKGYRFRGLSCNNKSDTGISLLYVPVEEGVGNEWGDIEQYELLDTDPDVGEFIDIYR